MTLSDVIHHHGNYDVELNLNLMISFSKHFAAKKKKKKKKFLHWNVMPSVMVSEEGLAGD